MADNDLADDLLPGASKIADFMGKSRRTTYNLLESGKLPAFRIGKIWHARKSTLLRHFQELETSQAAL